MIEERMIRVTWQTYYQLTHDDDSEIVIKDWNNLEPAPPKDFKPHCYGTVPWCEEVKELRNKEYYNKCEECPYRKRD
jgi:hypothetical protein